MNDISLRVSQKELNEFVNAYATMQKFLAKIIPVEDLYTNNFIKGMKEAKIEIENNQLEKVNSFEEFVV